MVCWRCVGGVLRPCGLVVRGGGVVVPMYVCVAWGLLPPWRFGVLVVVWFGGWWCVVLVGWGLWRVAGGVHPLWFGVLMV